MKVHSTNFIEDISKILGFDSGETKSGGETSPSMLEEILVPFGFEEKNLVDRNQILGKRLNDTFSAQKTEKFDYDSIQGVKGNKNVTGDFLRGVEGIAKRMGTKPEYLLSVMSFETGGTFSPSLTNRIGATGLIQFLPSTAEGLGTTTANLRQLSSTEQLKYVEKYFDSPSFKGKLGSVEGLYTAVLSGRARADSNDVLFTKGTKAYDQNPLDWNGDGKITAGEAATPVVARMFGGVKGIQQKLVDLGFVPEGQRKGFADGQWGKNTATALAKFQKANNLTANGSLNEATARALFNLPAQTPTPNIPTIPVKPKPVNNDSPATLQNGSRGKAVENLQDNLIALGFLSKAQKATGTGIFGPRTEKALRDFQRSANLEANGKFGPATERAMREIKLSLGRTTSVKNTNVTEGVQDQLVKLGYLTRKQVNTGYGTFGPQTEAAVKKFQQKNGIEQTGRIGELTYRTLFSSDAKRANPPGGGGNSNGTNFSVATNGTHYRVNPGILMTDSLRPKVEELANSYFKATGNNLVVTSGYRPPARQASAMYDLIVNRGIAHVQGLYLNKTAANQIINAYRNNSSSRETAVGAMTRAIQNQVDDGVYISRHLRSRAMDVSTGTNEATLRRLVSQMGGTVLNEDDHLHVQF